MTTLVSIINGGPNNVRVRTVAILGGSIQYLNEEIVRIGGDSQATRYVYPGQQVLVEELPA